jgi:hypothetical protein
MVSQLLSVRKKKKQLQEKYTKQFVEGAKENLKRVQL